MSTTMRLNLEQLNLRSLDKSQLDSWLQPQILALGRARQIDEANIRCARFENASPAYQVNIHLVTPGPDVFTEARDHTLRAAFAKALSQLRQQIGQRAAKRLQKLRNKQSKTRTL